MDAKLLELLVCPVTKGPLTYDRERQELVSLQRTAGLPGARRYSPCCWRMKHAR